MFDNTDDFFGFQDSPEWFRTAIETPYEHGFVEVLGCNIHYLRWGEKSNPGLLLVHGGAAHALWWGFLAPLLINRYYVVALDLSGHGDSGRRDEYPRKTWAEEVMAVCDAAEFSGPPIVVGHSMGGLVGIIAASLYGDRLAGAVIVDSPVRRPDPESHEGERGKVFRNPKVYPDVASALAHFRLVPEQPCENQYLVRYVALHSLRQLDPGVTWKFDANVFRRFSIRAMHEYLANTRCRVALFRGEFSLVVPPETGEYMYELLDHNAPMVEIPQAHHHLILDQPLAFIAALRAILADWEHSIPRHSASIDQAV